MAKKVETAEKLYHEALETLDGLHGILVDFADLVGVVPREPLLTDAGAHLPRSQFVVDGDDEPERGGLAFDTRMALCVTKEQGEAIAFELLRALREVEGDEVQLELDGRVMLKRGAAGDVRKVLQDE